MTNQSSIHEPEEEVLNAEDAIADADRLEPWYAQYHQPTSLATASVVPTGFPTPVSESLPTVVQQIVQVLRPEKIVLFGSYAYGIPTPDSDVDLLVVMESETSPLERYLSVSRLLRPRPFPVDIVVKTPTEIRHAWEVGDCFIQEILSRGEILYERQP